MYYPGIFNSFIKFIIKDDYMGANKISENILIVYYSLFKSTANLALKIAAQKNYPMNKIRTFS